MKKQESKFDVEEYQRLQGEERNGLYHGGYRPSFNGSVPVLSNRHDALLSLMALAKKHKEDDLIQILKDAYKINQSLVQGQLP